MGKDYQTPENRSSWIARHLPGFYFYSKTVLNILVASRRCKQNTYSIDKKIESSAGVLRTLERIGVEFVIENMSAFIDLKSPCVFVANHMSVLETFVLPCFIMPYRKITFVLKRSLTQYPIVKNIIHSLQPIVVDRENPRKDLRAVLDQGFSYLKENVSILIFPQTTRSLEFNPASFNTLGIKLAKKTKLPIVPIALKTDAWGIGRLLKDIGKIDPAKPVRMAFGDPVYITGNGKQEHQKIIQFIEEKLKSWSD